MTFGEMEREKGFYELRWGVELASPIIFSVFLATFKHCFDVALLPKHNSKRIRKKDKERVANALKKLPLVILSFIVLKLSYFLYHFGVC